MNKWVSVALCICGLGLGGMMLTGDSDGGRALIENAPYITDGKINPAYEGKVVIVAGKLKTEKPAVDEELGISFDSPILKRNVHVMVEKGSGSDIKRSWESMASSNIARMYKSAPPVITFYGVVKAGDFILDKTLLKKFAAGVNVNSLPRTVSYKRHPFIMKQNRGSTISQTGNQILFFPIWTVITESPIRNLLWRKIRRKPWWGFKKEIGSGEKEWWTVSNFSDRSRTVF